MNRLYQVRHALAVHPVGAEPLAADRLFGWLAAGCSAQRDSRSVFRSASCGWYRSRSGPSDRVESPDGLRELVDGRADAVWLVGGTCATFVPVGGGTEPFEELAEFEEMSGPALDGELDAPPASPADEVSASDSSG